MDAVGRQAAILADALDFEESPVDVTPDFLKVGEVRDTLVDAEVSRIAERGLGSKTSTFFEVLLQVAAPADSMTVYAPSDKLWNLNVN